MPRLLSRSSRSRSRKSRSRTVEQEGELSTPEKKQIFITPSSGFLFFSFFTFQRLLFGGGWGSSGLIGSVDGGAPIDSFGGQTLSRGTATVSGLPTIAEATFLGKPAPASFHDSTARLY